MVWIGLALALAVVGLALVGRLAYDVWRRTRALSRAVGEAADRLNGSLATLQDTLATRDVP